MRIIRSSSFNKSAAKLPRYLEELAEIKVDLFIEYPFHMSLETHKLHGRMKEKWAFSINKKYRITFEFITDDLVRFLDIGTHDIYD